MQRATKTNLRHSLDILARLVGCEFRLDHAYNAWRVMSPDGAHNHSPRLSGGKLMLWIDGAISGATIAAEERARVREHATRGAKKRNKASK